MSAWERLGAAHEEGEVVGAGHGERGVDDVVADAAVAEVDLEAVVEEGEDFHDNLTLGSDYRVK